MKRELQRSMYELSGPSAAQRLTLAALVALWVAMVWWLLLGGGIVIAGGWLGRTWKPGDPVRRACMAAAFTIYYVRILFTEFVFLKRGVSWGEVFTIAPWVLCIYVVLAVMGGRNASSPGALFAVGITLFVAESWLNSYAEYARHVWKSRPRNRGHLYTEGLFRYTRHPNYLGDLVSFSGLCLMTGAWVTVAIPLPMLAGFLFVNVPVLDAHLRQKYGAAFDEYAARTRRLIPFLY